MKKKIIGIDINEVMRAHWEALATQYNFEYGTEGITRPFDTYDYRKHFKFEPETEMIEYVKEDEEGNLIEASVDLYHEDVNGIPIDINNPEEAGIRTRAQADITEIEEEHMSADQVFERFMYQDRLFEIFGQCNPIYTNIDIDVRKFVNKMKDKYKIIIISNDDVRTIMPTLFFLSKMKITNVSEFMLKNKAKDVWDIVDYYVTTNPNMINEKPKNKKVIKLNRLYNKDNDADYTANEMRDLVNDIEFEYFMGITEKQKLVEKNEE